MQHPAAVHMCFTAQHVLVVPDLLRVRPLMLEFLPGVRNSEGCKTRISLADRESGVLLDAHVVHIETRVGLNNGIRKSAWIVSPACFDLHADALALAEIY